MKKKHEFTHKCSTEDGSSGSPILNINNKLICLHKEGYHNKFNKGTFLNFPIKKYIQLYCKNKNELLLQKFNKKYGLVTIKDTNITELNFYNYHISNELLKELCEIEFKQLKILNLERNHLKNIKALEKAKYEKLEILILGLNFLPDINILEKVNFKELKELNLERNRISDIKVLEKFKFEKLEILNLKANQISNINILETLNFNQLKKLSFKNNQISDIKVLKKVKFEKFEKINSKDNRINNFSIIFELRPKMQKLIYW